MSGSGAKMLHLSKLHATGNDFLVMVDMEGAWGERGSELMDRATRSALCDRATGVGADGLIRILPGTGEADISMELANADGAWAEMSGNGIRCLAWVAARHRLIGGTAPTADAMTVDTLAGIRTVNLYRSRGTGEVTSARVGMGAVTFDPPAIPLDAPSAFDLAFAIGDVRYRGDAAGMGNPHLVVVVDDPDAVPLTVHGPAIETDARFPARTNVEFISCDGNGGLQMRVWERGIGETRSCGTGACAAAAVAHRRELVGTAVDVTVPGGKLRVELGGSSSLDGEMYLSGPVVHVLDMDIDLDRLRSSAGLGAR